MEQAMHETQPGTPFASGVSINRLVELRRVG